MPFGPGKLTIEHGHPDYCLKWFDNWIVSETRFVYSNESEKCIIPSLAELASFAKSRSISVESEVSASINKWARFISNVLEACRDSARLDHIPIIDDTPIRVEIHLKQGVVYDELKPVVSSGYLIWHALRSRQEEGTWHWVLMRFKWHLETLETDECIVRRMETPN
jgi:hypothetical protein